MNLPLIYFHSAYRKTYGSSTRRSEACWYPTKLGSIRYEPAQIPRMAICWPNRRPNLIEGSTDILITDLSSQSGPPKHGRTYLRGKPLRRYPARALPRARRKRHTAGRDCTDSNPLRASVANTQTDMLSTGPRQGRRTPQGIPAGRCGQSQRAAKARARGQEASRQIETDSPPQNWIRRRGRRRSTNLSISLACFPWVGQVKPEYGNVSRLVLGAAAFPTRRNWQEMRWRFLRTCLGGSSAGRIL
jgi:hypothetical protein